MYIKNVTPNRGTTCNLHNNCYSCDRFVIKATVMVYFIPNHGVMRKLLRTNSLQADST